MPNVIYAEYHLYSDSKKPFMLSVFELDVIMLSAIMLNVMAPHKRVPVYKVQVIHGTSILAESEIIV